MPYNAPQIDFLGIFQAAMAAKDRRAMMEQQKQQFAIDRDFRQEQITQWKVDRATKAQERTDQINRQNQFMKLNAHGVETGDWTPMQVAFPKEYADIQTSRLANEKAQNDLQAAEVDRQRDVEHTTAIVQKSVADKLQADPTLAPKLQSYVDGLVRSKQIRDFRIPGNTLPEGMAGPQMEPNTQEIQSLKADADIAQSLMPKKTQNVEYDPIAKNVYFGKSLRPEDPGFTDAYEAIRLQRENDDKDTKSKEGTTNLRREFYALPVVKNTIELMQAHAKVMGSSDSGPGDMSLIFGYMKLLDPGSTVREGEAASAEQAGGVPGRIVNLYNRALTGERLAPELRAKFKEEASAILKQQFSVYNKYADHYGRIAKENNIDPKDVVLDVSSGPLPPNARKQLDDALAKGAISKEAYDLGIKKLGDK